MEVCRPMRVEAELKSENSILRASGGNRYALTQPRKRKKPISLPKSPIAEPKRTVARKPGRMIKQLSRRKDAAWKLMPGDSCRRIELSPEPQCIPHSFSAIREGT